MYTKRTHGKKKNPMANSISHISCMCDHKCCFSFLKIFRVTMVITTDLYILTEKETEKNIQYFFSYTPLQLAVRHITEERNLVHPRVSAL